MNIYRRSQAHDTKCIVVLLRADVTVTGRYYYVTMEVPFCDSVAKSGVTLQYRSSTLSMYGVRNSALSKTFVMITIIFITIHQTHYEKSDWSRAFNQFTIAFQLDMINTISAAGIAHFGKE